MTRTHIAVAIAAATAASAFAGKANAQAVVVQGPAPAVVVEERGGNEDANRAGFSVAALVGFDAVSGYTGFATGVRAGYTLPFHLYLGADATFYIAGGGAVISLAPEVGYDIGLRAIPLVIRPYIGLGFATTTVGSLSAFEFYPGCEVLYSITRGLFVGGDFRIPLIFFSGGGLGAVGASYGVDLLGTIGYKF
jgi:hypothetical protein